MSDDLITGIIIGLAVAAIIWLVRSAWARDRLPIKTRSAPRPTNIAVDDRPDDALPPSFIFPDRPSSDPPREIDDVAAYIKWALQNGGVHEGRLYHRFEIRGTEDGPVRLESVAVKVLNRRHPMRGVTWNSGAGGDSADRYLLAYLDEADEAGYAPSQRTVDRWNAAGDNLISVTWDLLEVSRTAVETFVVIATTEKYDCDFVIEVNYRGQYQSGTYEVRREDGKPFRVAVSAEPDRQEQLGIPIDEYEWQDDPQP